MAFFNGVNYNINMFVKEITDIIKKIISEN